MKKLLSVFFVLVVVMGSTSLHAQNFFLTDDDEREIPLNPAGPKEGGPVARSIIIQPASAYINNDIVTVVFNCDAPYCKYYNHRCFRSKCLFRNKYQSYANHY